MSNKMGLNGEIVVSTGGINWCWFMWLEVDGNEAKIVRQDRFHRFDDCQGAGNWPETDLSGEVFRAPGEDKIRVFGERIETAHRAFCKREELPYGDVVCIRRGKESSSLAIVR